MNENTAGHVCRAHTGPFGIGLEPCCEAECRRSCGWRYDEAYRRRKLIQTAAFRRDSDGLLRLHLPSRAEP